MKTILEEVNIIPGVNSPKINADISIHGESEGGGNGGGGAVAIKRFYYSSGNGIQAYEGFGFQPTSYVIQAWNASNSDYGSNSHGTFVDGSTRMYYLKRRQASEVESDYNTGQYGTTANIIAVYDDADNGTTAYHNNFTSDGVELNWTDGGVNVWFTITAYA